MTYAFNPRLFLENGPTVSAQAVHRRHDLLRFRYAAATPNALLRFRYAAATPNAAPPAAANSDQPACGVIRFAL